ncbi:MAG: cation:proton antiporter [Neisseriaceae bacterium]
MSQFFNNYSNLTCSIIILSAWILGEIGAYFPKIPKISIYIILGFIVNKLQIDSLNITNNSSIIYLVHIISGIMLFEFGYRINLNWLKNNPIIIVTSIFESTITFFIIFFISKHFGVSNITSFEIASLSIATSPFVIMYITREQQSAGQVTERILHLTALNCIYAVFMFKVVLGLMVLNKSGSVWQATYASLLSISLSIILGILLSFFLYYIIKLINKIPQNIPVVTSLIIILMSAITNSLGTSTIIAALTFGVVSRHMKIALEKKYYNFGALESVLTVVLFLISSSSFGWHNFNLHIELAILLFLSRIFIKVLVISVFSFYSGISFNKGVLTGLALTPVSICSILLLDQNFSILRELNPEILVFSTLILLAELVGPVLTQYAIMKAKEDR